jgi:hypothetical protein
MVQMLVNAKWLSRRRIGLSIALVTVQSWLKQALSRIDEALDTGSEARNTDHNYYGRSKIRGHALAQDDEPK